MSKAQEEQRALNDYLSSIDTKEFLKTMKKEEKQRMQEKDQDKKKKNFFEIKKKTLKKNKSQTIESTASPKTKKYFYQPHSFLSIYLSL